MIKNKREIFEEILLKNFDKIKSFNPSLAPILNKYKDGTFGLSTVGFSLYSNGHNLRGLSSKNKYGLIYEDGTSIFSIGYFRNELDGPDEDGYIFFVSPRGKEVLRKIREIIDFIERQEKILYKGFYIRFLELDQYIALLNKGFLPAKEKPWHPESPEEDETFNNSLVVLEKLIENDKNGKIKVKLVPNASKNSRKKIRYAYNRFNNFLERNLKLKFRLEEYQGKHQKDAMNLIDSHFVTLQKLGKNIGSTAQDHFNSIDPAFIKLDEVKAYIGFLDEVPVSIFVGEMVSSNRFALYTTFTLREEEMIASNFEQIDTLGLTALPTYAYIQLFNLLKNLGIKEIALGGSELPDLNRFKRQLGAKTQSSYWAVKLK